MSYTGIEGYATLAGLSHIADGLGIQFLDMGPIHWDDMVLDFKLTPLEQHFMLHGGARFDNFITSTPDDLASGELLIRWGGGENPTLPGDFYAPHDICVDSRGDVYVAEVIWSAGGSRGKVAADCHAIQKFVRQ